MSRTLEANRPLLPRWLMAVLGLYGALVLAAVVVSLLFAIVIDIDPIIVRLGPLALRWYSLMIMVGVMVGVWLSGRFAEWRGISADDVYSAAFWIVGGGIVGARLAHVIDRWDFYSANPVRMLAIHEGGLAIWGGVIAGGVAGWWFTRANGIPFWPFADSVAHGALLGQAIGRFGCIVNGDVAGMPTGGDWGFIYTNPNALLPRAEYFNTATHPYPLYEMGLDLALFGLLVLVARRIHVPGAVFLAYCAGYSLIRFLLTFVREEERFLFGLQQAQIISILVIVVAAYLYFYLRDHAAAIKAQAQRALGERAAPTPATS
jgi:phosphatidylglycerol---prolipoprotein diacylglyceryl transferase